MIAFPEGSDAQISIDYIDAAGDPVAPAGASYIVRDSAEVIVVGPTELTDLSGTRAEITVPAAVHTAPGGYSVELTMRLGDRRIPQTAYYGIFAVQRLKLLQNTFQTMAAAFFLANDLPNIAAFDQASDGERTVALIEAFTRLTRLNFVVPWPELTDVQSRLTPEYKGAISPRMWPLMTASQFAVYPQPFRTALCKAQIAEANEILTGDNYATRRKAGLMSESIGESSIMFRAGPRPLDTGVSRAALDYLSGYLNNRMTLTRS